MRIRLPRGRALEGPMLTAFEHERDRLDALMTPPNRPAPASAVAQNNVVLPAGITAQASAFSR